MERDVPVIIAGETSALRVNTTLQDPTGWSFRAQIRPTETSREVVHEWLNGQVQVFPFVLMFPLDPQVTDVWTWLRGVFGVEATTPEGQVLRVAQSPVVVSRSVVRELLTQQP